MKQRTSLLIRRDPDVPPGRLLPGLCALLAFAVSGTVAADETADTHGTGEAVEDGARAAASEPAASAAEETFDESLDEVAIDVRSSIDVADDREGASFFGDTRLSYIFDGEDLQGISLGKTDVLRLRWRLAAEGRFLKGMRGSISVAGLCSTEDCSLEGLLQPDISSAASIRDGEMTIDSAFLQWFRSDRYDIAIGRMQTKFVARGGVFSKSMDRNDSNNLRVNWTDGLHTTYRGVRGWDSHLIVQYNSEDGASNIKRLPLDFSSDKSRASYYVALESKKALRRMVQRTLSVSYLPSSLATNGLMNSTREDYWGVVGRLALRWPVRDEGWRLRTSGEVAYAGKTPINSAAGIAGDGDTGGLAWALTVSIMDFVPRHSFGVNYARTEAGWLLSPQYTPNEELYEARYMYRPTDRITLDVRGRWRYDLRDRLIDIPDRNNFDFYARATWSFGT
ncbi:MAG: hypothetical protein QNI96_05330 [Woeseiaceae bacterium]|nr:hypothetical protein [Woeseiaceae bacterium]